MKKTIVSVVAIVSFLSVGIASAQVYGSSYTSGSCVYLSSNLSTGSRGTEVRSLQTFLVNQNYPGGGSWMITGYFGQATGAALRIFQQSVGLPSTGYLDAQTRAAIQTRSCGNTPNTFNNYTYTYPNITYPTTYPTYPTTPTYPPYNYNNNYNYNTYTNTYPQLGNIVLTSLSANTGQPGSSITVYGTGFDTFNNTVYLGSSVIANVASTNGTSLTFSIPFYTPLGATQLKVMNVRGTSNALSFSVLSSPYSCEGVYSYYGTNCGGCYGVSCDGHAGQPMISSLTPLSGSVGTLVTIYGSGFTTTGNTIHFGSGIIANLSSLDGRGLSFVVPTTLTGYGAQQLTLGNYPVYVTNGRGENSNSVNFNVTSLAGSGGAPTIQSVTGPTSIAVGTQGTWTVVVNNNQTNSYVTVAVNWGDQNVYGASLTPSQTTYTQGVQTLTFTHTYLTSGTYTVTFSVSGIGGGNVSTATVNVGGTSNALSLSTLSPLSGSVGTLVTLTGTGFASVGNTIHFGVGGLLNVAATSGTTMTFVIPAHISPCNLIGTGYACGAPAQPVVPGSYPIYVTNASGATNILYFNVQ